MMDKRLIAEIEASREVRPFAIIAHGADVLILTAEEVEKGSYYTIMGSLLMTWFSFEAFLNHLGEKEIKLWKKTERIGVDKKYSMLCKKLSIVPNNSKRPYQSLKLLQKFRNKIAHGKTELLVVKEGPIKISSNADPMDYMPKAKWEKYCTLDNAKRAKEDIDKIIIELNAAADLGDSPFRDGPAISGISVISTNGQPKQKP